MATDMDETGAASFIEKSETTIENEDESDQAKASVFFVHFIEFILIFTNFCYCVFALQHYLESNEKYYLMAHRY